MSPDEFIHEFYSARISNIDDFIIDKINEYTFPEELKHKNVEFFHYYPDRIAIVWTTKGWNEYDAVIYNELLRYYQYLADKNQLDKDVLLEIVIQDDTIHKHYYELIVTNSGGNI